MSELEHILKILVVPGVSNQGISAFVLWDYLNSETIFRWVQICKCNAAIASTCGWVNCNCNSSTSVHNTITSSRSSQCQYFAIVSKECYASRLQTIVTWVDGQANILIVLKLHSCVEPKSSMVTSHECDTWQLRLHGPK